MATAKLTSKGQITLPKSVRDKLGVGSGDRVEFIESADEPGVFRVVAATHDVRELKGLIPRPEQAVSIEAMNKAIASRSGRR